MNSTAEAGNPITAAAVGANVVTDVVGAAVGANVVTDVVGAAVVVVGAVVEGTVVVGAEVGNNLATTLVPTYVLHLIFYNRNMNCTRRLLLMKKYREKLTPL